MSDGTPRFSRWFVRWWVAVIGCLMAVGGFVIYEAAAWSIPRGIARYGGSTTSSDWYLGFTDNPAFVYLQRLGEGLMLIGVVAFVATVVVRIVRRHA